MVDGQKGTMFAYAGWTGIGDNLRPTHKRVRCRYLTGSLRDFRFDLADLGTIAANSV